VGTLNHLGLRVHDSAALVEVQRRLEEAGIATQRQDGVECCYGRQTKFWVTDPDRHLWEIYVFEEDLDHSGFEDAPRAAPVTAADARVWAHRLTEAIPARIPHGDASLDEVRLEGTFNMPWARQQPGRILAEARRVLKPGGKIVVHALVGNRPLPGRPGLPGLAALVQYLPVDTDVLESLRHAGFAAAYYERLGNVPCFSVNGVEIREMRLWAWPAEDGQAEPATSVLYKGPFDQVTDDAGTVYRRGERVPVSSWTAAWLRGGPAASDFAFFHADCQ
jgi:SAM-dependent methyltransferase